MSLSDGVALDRFQGDRGPGSDTQSPSGKKMTDEDLLTLIAMYERASLGSQVAAGATISTTVYPSNAVMTTLEIDRYNALNAFFARPLGNEVENRNQVVLPVVRDTMTWIMPQLMRIFASTKSICRFDPVGQGDEDQAQMETEVINHIFMVQNDGFVIIYDFFWDALLMRNGYAEVHTEEETQVSQEKYTGLDQIEVATLLQDDADEELDVLEQREYPVDVLGPIPQTNQIPLGGQVVPLIQKPTVFDLKLRRTKKVKSTKITPLPPEEMRITPRARSGMEGIAFAMHQATKTRSDLITDGYDRELVDECAAGRPNWLEIDALARNQVVDQLSIENPSDRSMQEIEIRKVAIRVDCDGDGVAELRRVVIGGDKIFENEVIEETMFVSSEAMRMPHRHTGLSIYDLVMDLQIIQTNLWRQGLDNLTVANNMRYAVDWRNVNIDDLLSSRPHGPIRGNGPPSNWIQPIQPPSNLVEQVLPALQYIDQLRSNRTGIGKGTMGLDPDELQNVTKGGQLAAMSAQTLIVELIARFLAEGMRHIFLKIHSELMRHQDKPLEYQIAGKWVRVDPSSWRKRTRVSANVGLGSGNREEMRANVQLLAAGQQAAAQAQLVGPKQIYESFKLLCESLGFNNPERFVMDPQSQEYAQHMQQMAAQPHPQAPQVQAAQIRAQTEQSKQAAEDQRKIMELLGQLNELKLKLAADQQSQGQQIAHEAVQDQAARSDDAVATRTDELLTLAKILAPIIGQQLKGDESANAGQVLAQDAKTADAGIHEKLSASLDGLTQALGNMGKPRVATLSDGRQIRIE
jgi:hypothetical protein